LIFCVTIVGHTQQLISQSETVCSETLYDGELSNAMKLLRVDPTEIHPRQFFLLGTSFGMCLLLFCVFLLVLFLKAQQTSHFKFYAAFPIYRGCGLLLLAIWLWGCAVYVFSLFRINHVFILDADERTTMKFVDIFQFAAALTLFYMGSIVSYLIMISYGGTFFCRLIIWAHNFITICGFMFTKQMTGVFIFSTRTICIAPFPLF
jgi:hypothetical protein